MGDVRVGCIGLGNMGGGIAENIARAGFEVAVFDVRSEAAQRFGPLGARVAASPMEAATDADIVTVTVLNDAQVDEVLFGEEGAIRSLRPGAVVLIHSTISPATCRDIAARAGTRSIAVVDAPISGGESAAREGTLTLMIGGDADAVAACGPVLEAISALRFHVGGVGAGQVAKLVNNLMGIVNRIVVGEALALARTADLREDVVLELVRSSSGNSWQVEHWREMQAIAAQSTTGPAGMARMAEKDLGLAMQLARSLEVETPLLTAAYDHTGDLFTENG
jgi:3-hydroxyisobutyrate dehydrogenase-like beta-hydroxyacid dehydrogenase